MTPQRRRGRPTKKTPERLDTIVKAVRQYAHTLEEAADLAGVSRDTVRSWAEKDLDFSMRLAAARAQLRAVIRQAVIRRGLGSFDTTTQTWTGGDVQCLLFLARTIGGLTDTRPEEGGGDLIVESAVPVPSPLALVEAADGEAGEVELLPDTPASGGPR